MIDGESRSFTNYTREFVRQHYPDVGHKAIMVPPLVFHQNWLSTNKEATRKLHESTESDAFKEVSDCLIKIMCLSVCVPVYLLCY